MIVGLGVDAFEVSRMEQALREGDPGFLHALFTPSEIAHCRRQPRPAAHYASCFALKEATFKALALDEHAGGTWHDVELRIDVAGRRSVLLHGRLQQAAHRLGVARVLASFAYTRKLALAAAVLES